MVNLKIVFLLFSISVLAMAKTNISNGQDKFYVGEKSWDLYFGPLSPSMGKHTFLDKELLDNYLDNFLIPSATDLEYFLDRELLANYECPIGMMSGDYEYIRYLYRLLSLSFLFEELRELQRVSISLRLKGSTCKVDWGRFLKQCKPKSEFMSTFTKRSKYFIKDLKDFLVLKKREKVNSTEWIKKFSNKKLVGRDRIVGNRLFDWCRDNSCGKMNSKKLGKALYDVCVEDLGLFNKICSEEDDFYGLYDLPFMAKLILDSHVIHLLSKNMNARACLYKFSSLGKGRENLPAYIPTMFREINNQLSSAKDARYRQGMLFLPGSLQEFDRKGLKDFLFVPKEVPTAVPTKAPVIVATAFPTAEPLPTASPTAVPTAIPSPTPTVRQLSYFGRRVEYFRKKNFKSLAIDLELLKRDFIFSERLKDKMNKRLSKFLKRKSLRDMKRIDKLGTAKAPLPILFLKFFIETEKYQALFNIIGELGNYFYVYNDIDKEGKPVMVELKFVNNQWRLRLVKYAPMKKKIYKIKKKRPSKKKASGKV